MPPVPHVKVEPRAPVAVVHDLLERRPADAAAADVVDLLPGGVGAAHPGDVVRGAAGLGAVGRADHGLEAVHAVVALLVEVRVGLPGVVADAAEIQELGGAGVRLRVDDAAVPAPRRVVRRPQRQHLGHPAELEEQAALALVVAVRADAVPHAVLLVHVEPVHQRLGDRLAAPVAAARHPHQALLRVAGVLELELVPARQGAALQAHPGDELVVEQLIKRPLGSRVAAWFRC